jgi:PAS domain S-box-containing protein
MVSDATGVITLWNPACERMFGFSEAEALGASLDIIIPERQRARHWAQYAKTMSTGVTRYGDQLLRVPALHKDGHSLSIAFTVGLIKAADGSVSGVLAIVRDETSRWAEERALKRRVADLESGAAQAVPAL